MRRSYLRLLRVLNWLALAYLGLWLSLVLDTLLPDALFAVLGGRVQNWRVSPLYFFPEMLPPLVSSRALRWLRCVPLLVDAGGLAAIALFVSRRRGSFLRATVLFCGLGFAWLLAFHTYLLMAFNYGPLAGAVHLLHGGQPGQVARWTIAASVCAALFFAGALLARELVHDPKAYPGFGSRWLAPLWFALPALLLQWVNMGFRVHFWEPEMFAWMLAPAGLCALFAVPLLWWKSGHLPGDAVRNSGAYMWPTAIALTLAAILTAAPRVRSWQMDRGLASYVSPHFVIRYNPADYKGNFIAVLAAEQERRLNSDAARLGISLPEEPFEIVLYRDFIAHRRATDGRSVQVVEGKKIRTVIAGYIQDLDPASTALALLERSWGTPGNPLAARWIARWAAASWEGEPITAATARIESEMEHYSLSNLLSGRTDGEISPLVREPLGAAWVAWLAGKTSTDGLRRFYFTPAPADIAKVSQITKLSPVDLEREWNDWCVRAARDVPPAKDAPGGRAIDSFLRGVSFSQEGWGDSLAALVSTQSAEQLRRIRSLAANAVALVPYGFFSGGAKPFISYRGTGETDEDMRQAAWVARELGMKVMLKPQLWAQWGGFTGKIHFDDPAAREHWMRSYREFILHYARLAELGHMDVLCVGTELEGMTDDEAAWRQLIADIRRVYHGPLTYASNWNKELDALRFWDALDFIGLNDYFPLAAAPSASPDDLQAGAQKVAQHLAVLATRWHKPIFLTEIGYPSVHGAAAQPWVEDGVAAPAPDEQAACYEAAFRGLHDQSWLAGLFWWKWHSSEAAWDEGSYSPAGKPAEQVISRWYAQMAADSGKKGSAGGSASLPGDSAK